MTGIVLAAALVTLVVLTASAVAWRSWKTDWMVFSAFMAGLPLSYLVNKFVKPPVILSIQRLAWPSAESPAPMTFALLILWVAPFVEEAAKLLPSAIPAILPVQTPRTLAWPAPSPPCVDEDGPAPAGHRDVPSARLRNTPYKFKPSSSTSSASKSFRFGMAAGFGFGLGEAWYLAWGIARTPGYGSLPFSSHHGYIAERLVITFAHGVMTVLAVSRLPRPSGRPLLRYSSSDFARARMGMPVWATPKKACYAARAGSRDIGAPGSAVGDAPESAVFGTPESPAADVPGSRVPASSAIGPKVYAQQILHRSAPGPSGSASPAVQQRTDSRGGSGTILAGGSIVAVPRLSVSVCGYMQAVFLHVLVNARPLFYQSGIIGTVGHTMFTLASIAALVIVFMRLRSS